MLSKSDIDIFPYISFFSHIGMPFAFLVPTETGYRKSIMDATAPVREFLLDENIHDYTTQRQGQENKKIIPAAFVNVSSLTDTCASLYRPITKQGDPRIWFHRLKDYCSPNNLLAITSFCGKLYVFNLSNTSISKALSSNGFPATLLQEGLRHKNVIANELLQKLHLIHSHGFIPSTTSGNTAVGDTLEHELGIKRNNSKEPDYKGIELKATRISINNKKRNTTRATLFTKVPDNGMSYREIVENYGKIQTPRGTTSSRLQLYETLCFSKKNAYDLQLSVDESKDKLYIVHKHLLKDINISSWDLEKLRARIVQKHHETFWVKAESKIIEGKEYFRYDTVLHTKNPNTSIIIPLIQSDKLTIDLAAHFDSNNTCRDHGMLFKMLPEDLPLLLGKPIIYNL